MHRTDIQDIVFAGGGISTALTIRAFYERLLKEKANNRQYRLTVIEKAPDFWKGMPYGSRSSVNGLIITSLADFLNEQEQPAFYVWLRATQNEWLAWYTQAGGAIAETWVRNNLPLIEREDWNTIYIPRSIYGRYLSQKLEELISTKEFGDRIILNKIVAEVTGVKKSETGLFEIAYREADLPTATLQSHKVVIAAGSAPTRKMLKSGQGGLYINDIYTPSVEKNLESVQKLFASKEQKPGNNMLIIGTNASSLEFIYLFAGMPEFRAITNKVVLMSSSGELPDHTDTSVVTNFPVPALELLEQSGSWNMDSLMVAAYKDLELAKANGTNMAYVGAIVRQLLKLLQSLSEEDKKQFFGVHALKFRDKFRRTGPEYKLAARMLDEQGFVEIVKGRFQEADYDQDGATVKYLDSITGTENSLPLKFNVILNCTGSHKLDQSGSELILSMLHSGLCVMNLSGTGIEVNDHFEASPNLYIIGPMLGGNMNKLIHFWQLENASRLTYLAPFLAEELV